MAGADGNCRYDLEQWKKALLSRDFDLVHTQLLMLGGDVTPSERAQLVQEIFTAVQQIEELTIGKPDSQGAENPKLSAVQEPQPHCKRSATSRAILPNYSDDSREREISADSPYEPAYYRSKRHQIITELPKNELGHKYVECPVCESRTHVARRGVRDDWYCNSCRLFKLRLERKRFQRQMLPSCDHKGKRISVCKGCRRFKLEVFWMEKRQHETPYSLPLMGSDVHRNVKRSDSEGTDDKI